MSSVSTPLPGPDSPLPTGKLPPELLLRLVGQAPTQDDRLVLGPGVGLDCAVLDAGPELWVFKSDPITFATDEIGWYAVQINANDIATTGATPRWFLATILLPEKTTTPALVERLASQLFQACRDLGVTFIGGHTEITYGISRPILSGTMVGTVDRQALITPLGARPGDHLLLTKGIPIEATAILAREMPDHLRSALSETELQAAAGFLHQPGISVVRDAHLAIQAGPVHAMHDPTEGGLAGALWELADACGCSLWIDPATIPMPELSARICHLLGLNPLATIASGALLLAVPPAASAAICSALVAAGIPCSQIGRVEAQPPAGERPSVWQAAGAQRQLLPRPERDEIARIFSG